MFALITQLFSRKKNYTYKKIFCASCKIKIPCKFPKKCIFCNEILCIACVIEHQILHKKIQTKEIEYQQDGKDCEKFERCFTCKNLIRSEEEVHRWKCKYCGFLFCIEKQQKHEQSVCEKIQACQECRGLGIVFVSVNHRDKNGSITCAKCNGTGEGSSTYLYCY